MIGVRQNSTLHNSITVYLQQLLCKAVTAPAIPLTHDITQLYLWVCQQGKATGCCASHEASQAERYFTIKVLLHSSLYIYINEWTSEVTTVDLITELLLAAVLLPCGLLGFNNPMFHCHSRTKKTW